MKMNGLNEKYIGSNHVQIPPIIECVMFLLIEKKKKTFHEKTIASYSSLTRPVEM